MTTTETTARVNRIKQEVETVYKYLIDTIPTAKDQNKHADACRNAEAAQRILKGLLTELKNK